jgi:hypothetical protein
MDADLLLSVGAQQAKNLEGVFRGAGFHAEMTRGDLDDPIPGMLKVK